MSNPPGRFTSGTLLAGYVLIEPLGEDQLGFSWSAQETDGGRLVALQLIHPHVAADAERVSIIETETAAATALNHPSIARVYAFDQPDGMPAIVSLSGSMTAASVVPRFPASA